jgi:hypothetical protein
MLLPNILTLTILALGANAIAPECVQARTKLIEYYNKVTSHQEACNAIIMVCLSIFLLLKWL